MEMYLLSLFEFRRKSKDVLRQLQNSNIIMSKLIHQLHKSSSLLVPYRPVYYCKHVNENNEHAMTHILQYMTKNLQTGLEEIIQYKTEAPQKRQKLKSEQRERERESRKKQFILFSHVEFNIVRLYETSALVTISD